MSNRKVPAIFAILVSGVLSSGVALANRIHRTSPIKPLRGFARATAAERSARSATRATVMSFRVAIEAVNARMTW